MTLAAELITLPAPGVPGYASAVAIPTDLPWYCFQARPQAFPEAKRQLERQGFQVYWPREWKLSSKRIPFAEPLFGPYGFVAFDVADPSWRVIHSTYGVRRLLSRDAERPIRVPDLAMQRLTARWGDDGLLPYERQSTKHAEIPCGSRVIVTDGPFAGLTGVYQRPMHERVALLLNIMGRQVETAIDRASVEIAA